MPILYVALAIVLAALGGWVGGSRYGAKDCQADVKIANAKVEVKAAKDGARTAKQSGARGAQRARDEAMAAPIVEEIKTDVRENPAPADCRVTPRGLSRLNDLIDQANTPGGVREAGATAEANRDGDAGRARAVGR